MVKGVSIYGDNNIAAHREFKRHLLSGFPTVEVFNAYSSVILTQKILVCRLQGFVVNIKSIAGILCVLPTTSFALRNTSMSKC